MGICLNTKRGTGVLGEEYESQIKSSQNLYSNQIKREKI